MAQTINKTGFAIEWDKDGERLYETGVERAVLYVSDGQGGYGDAVAWNGITSFEESPSGAEANALYADDIKYLNLLSKEEYACTIGAYTYPDAFAECDGSASLGNGALKVHQQPRKKFCFCCTTKIGNDQEQSNHGYVIHIVYNCLAAPSSRSYATENDSPEAIEFSWELSTEPVNVTGGAPTCNVDIDVTKIKDITVSEGTTIPAATVIETLEKALFGVGSTKGKVLMPDQIISILTTGALPTTLNVEG